MSVKLLTERHLEFLSLKGGCTGSPESTMSKCHIIGNHISLLKNKCHNHRQTHKETEKTNTTAKIQLKQPALSSSSR